MVSSSTASRTRCTTSWWVQATRWRVSRWQISTAMWQQQSWQTSRKSSSTTKTKCSQMRNILSTKWGKSDWGYRHGFPQKTPWRTSVTTRSSQLERSTWIIVTESHLWTSATLCAVDTQRSTRRWTKSDDDGPPMVESEGNVWSDNSRAGIVSVDANHVHD